MSHSNDVVIETLKADGNELAIEGLSVVTDNNDPEQLIDYLGEPVVTYSSQETR
jgi:hypothetical protein